MGDNYTSLRIASYLDVTRHLQNDATRIEMAIIIPSLFILGIADHYFAPAFTGIGRLYSWTIFHDFHNSFQSAASCLTFLRK
jgi:hypothetical protein